MRTNKDFRKATNNTNGGEQTKGKLMPAKKEKISKSSVFEEFEEDEEIGYLGLKEKDSITDYYDDEDDDDEYYDDDEEYDDEYDDEDED